jgi:hypothetical protein
MATPRPKNTLYSILEGRSLCASQQIRLTHFRFGVRRRHRGPKLGPRLCCVLCERAVGSHLRRANVNQILTFKMRPQEILVKCWLLTANKSLVNLGPCPKKQRAPAAPRAGARSCDEEERAVTSIARNAPEILFLAACSFLLASIAYCTYSF